MAGANAELKLCKLEETVGRHAVCPEDACVFWEPGGAVLDGRCLLEGIDFGREPTLAGWLLDVRDTIDRVAHR